MDMALPGGFEEVWPEFAVSMLNQAPFDFFRQEDGVEYSPDAFADEGYGDLQTFRHHDEIVQFGGRVGDESIGVNESDFLVDWGPEWHLSFTYNSYKFPDPDVSSVAFYNGMTFSADLTEIEGFGKIWSPVSRPPEEVRGLTVQALIKYAGQDWQLEDWTFYPYKTFCRDVTSERIEELIIITANSVPELGYEVEPPSAGSVAAGPRIWVSDVGCARWEGSMESVQTGEDGFRMEITANDLAIVRDPAQAGAPCCGGYNVNYVIADGELEWEVSGQVGDCTASGNGTAPIENLHVMSTYNYVPEGPVHRVAQGALNTNTEQHYSLDCPGEDVDEPFYPAITFPLSETLLEVDILGSEFFGTTTLGPITVTWNLHAVKE
jgi:hypothetical protein